MGKVLVTGGAGLLGTSLTLKLKALGMDVMSTYFTRPPSEELAPLYKRYDLSKYEDCLAATKGQDYVVIGAVQATGVKGMSHSPTASILPNLQIHAGMFEACSQNGVKKVVWVSSSTVYQEAFYPIREDQLDLNQPPYGLYQGIGWVYRYLEQLAECYSDKCGLQVGIIRTASIYGPFDRFDDERSHVIPALIKRALQRETPFVVWGGGETVRDFVYVDDLAEAVVKLLGSDCTIDPVNFSSGRPVTIGELVDTVLEICGHPVEPHYDSTKPTAVPYRALDNTKFDTLLGRIERTPLEDGIAKTIEWYKSSTSRD
jgi:GDP-L-fucose synthase